MEFGKRKKSRKNNRYFAKNSEGNGVEFSQTFINNQIISNDKSASSIRNARKMRANNS